jgi:hypothetical protein
MRRTFATLAAAAVAALSLSALAGASTPAPKGLPGFYAVPNYPATDRPGTLLKYQLLKVPAILGATYRVMYLTERYNHHLTAATGYVVVPSATAPKGGFPVIDWSHGTNGMADVCAPSLKPGSDVPASLINLFLSKGWVFTASDYQGEGTPGLMPYIAGISAADDSINIVRAAHHFTKAHASSTWVEWGHSEGGQTAMFVDHLAPSYAPELSLKGVVAGAPPSQFAFLYGALKTSPFAYYLIMAAAGLHAYYGNTLAPLSLVMTAKAISFLPDLNTSCSKIAADVAPYVTSGNFAALVKADPYSVPAWKKLLRANDPGTFVKKTSVPLLMIQGGADEQIPVISTQILNSQMCAIGQTTQRWIYPGQSHAGVIGVSYLDMVKWLSNRLAGVATPDPYVPVGLSGVTPTTQSCN